MKVILRHYVIDTVCLYAISNKAGGMVFGNGIPTLLVAGIAVTAVSLIARPIINLLLLPINLITFGLFRWVASSFIIYLSTLIVPSFKVVGFYFTGLSTRWVDLPSLNLSGIMAYIGFSFLLSIFTSSIYWLIK
jgi:putative membrane protein